MAYTIQISELQRNLIMQSLTHLGADHEECQDLRRTKGEVYETKQEELVCLIHMFGLLVDDEKENPGNLHGFCL